MRDHQIDQSLHIAILSFSARWLPLVSDLRSTTMSHDEIVQALWRAARREMLKVINRTSYRSMLSLFLFGLTPIPSGISDEEELDGISAELCVQAALQQVQTLRARQRGCQFNGAKVAPSSDNLLPSPAPSSASTTDFISAESKVYWAALTFDTSATLTLNCRSSLCSGLLGFASESCWRLVESRASIFHDTTEDWRVHGFEASEERASQIILASCSWKLYIWKMITVLREALRDGYGEDEVERAYTAVLNAIDRFNITYLPLLAVCERRLQFLSQEPKLNWCKSSLRCTRLLSCLFVVAKLTMTTDDLMLHYHLAILMLVDAIEVAGRSDLLPKLTRARTEAEHGVVNTLRFGLDSKFTIPRLPHEDMSEGENGQAEEPDVAVSFVAIDPYPHHVVAAVQLVSKAVSRDFLTGKVRKDAFGNLQSTLMAALEQLPQSSKSVQAGQQQMQGSLSTLQRLRETTLTPDTPLWKSDLKS